MTTLVCRFHSRHRALIRVRRDLGPRPLYLGTLVDDRGRPARRPYGGRPVRGQVDTVAFRDAPARAGAYTATGLCELLICLDGDAELFA